MKRGRASNISPRPSFFGYNQKTPITQHTTREPTATQHPFLHIFLSSFNARVQLPELFQRADYNNFRPNFRQESLRHASLATGRAIILSIRNTHNFQICSCQRFADELHNLHRFLYKSRATIKKFISHNLFTNLVICKWVWLGKAWIFGKERVPIEILNVGCENF